jgi:hypothetical protein
MSKYEDTFQWFQFPEGKVRFSGGIRGWDERGYDTFAVELDDEVVYGEIDNVFLANHNDFNLQVVSFGYGMRENVGILNDGSPGRHAQGRFPAAYLTSVQSLVVQLVRAALHFEDRPTVLTEYPAAHFQGKVIFHEGWAVGASAREVSVWPTTLARLN